jgi:LysM repeat protein
MGLSDRVEDSQKKDRVCPYLGIRSDAGTALAYPSLSNCCFHAKPVYPIALYIQDTCCLSGDYTQCEEFGREPGQSLPDHMRAKVHHEWKRKRAGWFWIVLSTFLITLVALALWQLAPAGLLAVPNSRKTITASVVSASGGTIQTLTHPIATATTVLIPGPTATPVLIPSPTARTPHTLETPLGLNNGFIIHKVQNGESLTSIANQYRTTIETLQASNLSFPIPIRTGWVIVIPVNRTDTSGSPAFEPYQVDENISVDDLSEKLSINADDLRYYNGFSENVMLTSGEWVLIPRFVTPAP